MKKKICIITGSSGAVGSDISAYFIRKNWRVIQLSRSKKKGFYFYSLNNPEASRKHFVTHADLFIHCAFEFNIKNYSRNYKTNVIGSYKTFKIAKEKKVKKIINISSLSSFGDAKSIYGKIKFAIEKKSRKFGVYNLRCGLYSSERSKLYSKIKKLSKRNYFFPLIGDGSSKLHLMDTNKLIDFILKINENFYLFKNFYFVGNKKPITLKNLILSFSKKKLFIPINLEIIKFILSLFEICKIRIGFTPDNLLGLINYNQFINFTEYRNNKNSF
jgi:nucleoside-diphosphate-sugar epimerase